MLFDKGEHQLKHINSVLRSFYNEFEELEVRKEQTGSEVIRKQVDRKQIELW